MRDVEVLLSNLSISEGGDYHLIPNPTSLLVNRHRVDGFGLVSVVEVRGGGVFGYSGVQYILNTSIY